MITRDFIVSTLGKKELCLVSTHDKLSIPIINRIYSKMKIGIEFDAIKVDDNLIIDGHHRYVSSQLAEYELKYGKSTRTSATKECEWCEVDFVDEEWDTEDKIRRLNEQDAEFNQIPLDQLVASLV